MTNCKARAFKFTHNYSHLNFFFPPDFNNVVSGSGGDGEKKQVIIS